MKNKIYMEAFFVSAVVAMVLMSCGIALAGDVNSSYDEGTTLDVTANDVQPVIEYRNITQGGPVGTGNTILGAQGDVNSVNWVTINVSQSNGLDSLDYINVSAYFDFTGSIGSYDDASGANYKWKLEYNNVTGTEDWSLVSTHPNNEIELNASSPTVNWRNSTIINWTVQLNMSSQIKHAASGTTGGHDNDNTWDVKWLADPSSNLANATEMDEFGIYKYVSITSSNTPTGSTVPGSTASLDPVSNITFKTNDKFNMSVQLNQTLHNDTLNADIPIDNIQVWASSHPSGDWLTTHTSFVNEGEPLFLNTTGKNDNYSEGNAQNVKTDWEVFIPYGTPAGEYTATVTYTIKIDPDF